MCHEIQHMRGRIPLQFMKTSQVAVSLSASPCSLLVLKGAMHASNVARAAVSTKPNS